MKCATCKSDILPMFKHAISVNECPACGGQIMDEETLAIIEDVENTISSEVTLRDGTAQKLAMSIVAKYDITLRGEAAPARTPVRQQKIAPPSIAQQLSKREKEPKNIISVSELDNDKISEEERERIIEDVIRKKFNMVDQATLDANNDEDSFDMLEEDIPVGNLPPIESPNSMSKALFGAPGGVLEEERLLRLAKQQQALGSGGTFRRGS